MTSTPSTSNIESLVELIATCAYVAWSNALSQVYNPASPSHYYYKRMESPQVGDLVVEVTNWKAPALNRVGRLIDVGMKPPPYMDEATYDIEEWGKPWPPYLEKVWTIETLDGRTFTWWNASFRVVPEDPFRHQGQRP